MPKEIPRWVDHTPIVDYSLTMSTDSGTREEIELTRAEYIDLKSRIAETRGYLATHEPYAEQSKSVLNDAFTGFAFRDGCGLGRSIEQIAKHVIIARDLYAHDAGLISVEDPKLDAVLDEIAEEKEDSRS